MRIDNAGAKTAFLTSKDPDGNYHYCPNFFTYCPRAISGKQFR
jgi:hypothetical protein